MSNGKHIKRITNTPMSKIPDDLIRTTGPIQMMLGPAPDGGIAVGLLFTAPPPLGPVEYMLNRSQVIDLQDQLNEFMALDDSEVAALLTRLHGHGRQ